jgi:NADPH:quinone reductase-like Zn-dependent oxidoreductase
MPPDLTDSDTMRAFVYRRYGGPEVLQIEEVPKPVPKPNEVLVRIHATTVNSGDWRLLSLTMPRGFGVLARPALGFTGPRKPILGTELAGIIEAIGKDVTKFKPGDAVFAFPGGSVGSHAEYRAVAEDGPIAPKPKDLSFAEAASLSFGGSTALHFLKKAKLAKGEKLLVIGASGAVGTAMVQLGRHLGAEVTGVTSRGNIALVRALGAARVIDYTSEKIEDLGETFDVIADTVGSITFGKAKSMLKEKGRFLAVSGELAALFDPLFAPLSGSKRAIAGPASEKPEYIRELAGLAETGALRPVIDRTYAFADLPKAFAYVATGRKRGSVVVTLP